MVPMMLKLCRRCHGLVCPYSPKTAPERAGFGKVPRDISLQWQTAGPGPSQIVSAIEISSRRRKRWWTPRRFARQCLENPCAATREGERDTREISDPDAILLLAYQANCLFPRSGEALAPELASAGIVWPPSFDVVHLESSALHGYDRVANVVELAAGKNVFRQRTLFGPHPSAPPGGLRRSPRDGVIEKETVGGEEWLHFGHVAWNVCEADVLVHAHRSDFIVDALD